MIVCRSFAGRRVAVFGLGRSGLTAAASLLAGGAHVVAWDDGETGRSRAAALGVEIADLRVADWSNFAALVLSPGVPLTHPQPHWTVALAQAAGCAVIGDTELFFRARADAASHLGHTPRIIAITGTNGKSTTSALTAHLLMSAGVPCALGGNIGDAVLGLPEFDTTRVYVVELSSYQIDLTPSLHPSAAALLNITPDHLDRHGTLQNYAAVKARIFAQLGAGDTAVVALDDPLCRAIAAHIPSSATRVTITAEATPASQDPAHAADLTADLTAEIIADLIAEQGRLFLRRDDRRIEAATFADNIALAGAHNGQNVAAAWMLASAVGTPPDALQHGLATFPGLAHRLEFVGHLPKRDGRILFVNDSKGTNADAAAHALAAFDDVFWIAGGRAKEGGIEPLAEHFPRVRSAFLVGEAARDFAATLEGHCPVAISGDVGRAVVEATTAAAQSPSTSPVVLLSPAAASFDQFADFEARGDAFKAKLADLPGFVSAAEARAAGKPRSDIAPNAAARTSEDGA